MPPSSFNQMEGNRTADWDTMLQARAMVEGDGGADGYSGVGPIVLIFGAAVLAIILVAMAIGVG